MACDKWSSCHLPTSWFKTFEVSSDYQCNEVRINGCFFSVARLFLAGLHSIIVDVRISGYEIPVILVHDSSGLFNKIFFSHIESMKENMECSKLDDLYIHLHLYCVGVTCNFCIINIITWNLTCFSLVQGLLENYLKHVQCIFYLEVILCYIFIILRSTYHKEHPRTISYIHIQ
jgi:hypothetical protein